MASLYELKQKQVLRRRSRLEVVMDILQGSIEPAKITRIMARDVANIDYANARAFLTYLKGNRMIEYIQMGGETFYKTTDEGKRVLRTYHRLAKRLGM